MPLRVADTELRELLVEQLEVVRENDFETARTLAQRLRIPLDQALVERGYVPRQFLLEQLARAWNVGFVDLQVYQVRTEALAHLREDYARAHVLIPFALDDGKLHVAMEDPRDRRVLRELQRLTRLTVVPYLASEAAIRRAHLLYKGDLRDLLRQAVDDQARPLAPGPGVEEPAATLLTRILEYAAVVRASDIHIEPFEFETLVRCRVDGVLRELLSLPPPALTSLVARIKALAGLRIDERRAPQDGHFRCDLDGLTLDLRVSTLPSQWGEKTVMRVVPKEAMVLDLEDVGLSTDDQSVVLRNLLRPHGMILVTGPTGSGKTTTLYAMLARLGYERQSLVNISTIEDTIERPMPRVTQVTVNPAAGIDFATGLRALLRQDPDILMVGEIRDLQTAEIAVRAALVGRLLLSSLHTNDATSAPTRLMDMGVEPYLLASTLSLVVAQRLARRICHACRESVAPEPAVLDALCLRDDFEESVRVLRVRGVIASDGDRLAGVRLFRGRGCARCEGTGFSGRLGIFEILEIDDELRRLVMERRDAPSVRRLATAASLRTMFQDALAKAVLGETTIDEVLRATA